MNTALSRARPTRFSVYLPLAAIAAVIAVAGFWRSYFGPLLEGRVKSDLPLHLHAIVMMGWIGLVGLQAWLAASGRTALHVRVGRFGMAYGVFLIATALGFALLTLMRRIEVVGVDGVKGGFLAPLSDMVVFGIFLAGAWIMRKRSDFHRRFILLATTTILIAAVGRGTGGTGSVALRDVLPFLALWLSPLWIAMAWDWFKHRTVHAAYVLGALLLIALRYRQLIRETDWWMAFSRAITRWVAGHLM
jgi:hypothetical protein